MLFHYLNTWISNGGFNWYFLKSNCCITENNCCIKKKVSTFSSWDIYYKTRDIESFVCTFSRIFLWRIYRCRNDLYNNFFYFNLISGKRLILVFFFSCWLRHRMGNWNNYTIWKIMHTSRKIRQKLLFKKIQK